MNTETNFQKVGKYKVDVADETNQAIRFVKSNPKTIKNQKKEKRYKECHLIYQK